MKQSIVEMLVEKVKETMESEARAVKVFISLKSGICDTATVDYIEIIEDTLMINGGSSFTIKDINAMKVM